MIEKYFNNYINNFDPAKKWTYEAACVLLGAIQLYEATNKPLYLDFAKEYIDTCLDSEGNIIGGYKLEDFNLDNIKMGSVLLYLYEKLKEDKYHKAIEILLYQLKDQPRTESNNFWHKKIYPNQVWLDGLYMAMPFYVAYETKYHGKENYLDIFGQYQNVRKNLFDKDKRLYYHAFDESRQAPWANKETGLSQNFWLRAMGWYLVSLIDVLDEISIEIYEQYNGYKVLFKEAIAGILQYQDKESKLFYQVIDRPEADGNYLETSGSAMIAYAILKGCRLGILQEEKYRSIGEGILNSIIENRLVKKDEGHQLTGICEVAGLGPGKERDGSLAYYFSEPIVSDDPKGVGAFIMAYAQYLMLKEESIW